MRGGVRRESESEREKENQRGASTIGERERERERRVTELVPAVHRPSQEQTLVRLFFLVLFIIISPKRQSTHHTLE